MEFYTVRCVGTGYDSARANLAKTGRMSQLLGFEPPTFKLGGCRADLNEVIRRNLRCIFV